MSTGTSGVWETKTSSCSPDRLRLWVAAVGAVVLRKMLALTTGSDPPPLGQAATSMVIPFSFLLVDKAAVLFPGWPGVDSRPVPRGEFPAGLDGVTPVGDLVPVVAVEEFSMGALTLEKACIGIFPCWGDRILITMYC